MRGQNEKIETKIYRESKNSAGSFLFILQETQLKKLKGKRVLFISVYGKYSVLEFHGVPSSPPAPALLLCK